NGVNKKEKDMKKITTALALIALIVALSAMAFGQPGKRNRHGIQSTVTRKQHKNVPTARDVVLDDYHVPLCRDQGRRSPHQSQAAGPGRLIAWDPNCSHGCDALFARSRGSFAGSRGRRGR